MIIELDMYQTLAIAVVVLMLGKFLRKKCSLLEKFCIPAPVVGGVLFAVFTCVCYVTGIVEFTFDDILKEVCMVFFFTSVGFQANLKVLKSGGKSMLVFLSLVIALILAQNFLAVGLSNVMRISESSLETTVPMPMAMISWNTAEGYMLAWRSCLISSSTSRLSSSCTTVSSSLCFSIRRRPMGPPIMLPAIRP